MSRKLHQSGICRVSEKNHDAFLGGTCDDFSKGIRGEISGKKCGESMQNF